MKKLWLRGVLLGVSLALLLVGGAAAVREMTLTAVPYCFKCQPYEADPDPGFFTTLTLRGHGANGLEVQPEVELEMCQEWWHEGELVAKGCEGEPPEEDPAVAQLLAFCGAGVPKEYWRFYVNSGGGWDPVLGLLGGVPWEYGRWTVVLSIWSAVSGEVSAGALEAGPASADFRVAEDCTEFVPEPGSIMLLGSGLVGLAGYATLRWRSRQ